MMLVSKFCLAASVVLACSDTVADQENPLAVSSTDATPSPVFHCQPGPWGELEYVYTYLEAPERIIDLIPTPFERTLWHLPGKTETELREFLIETGLREAQVEEILADSLPFQTGPPFRLRPSRSLIRGLDPETRKKIYLELNRWSENRYFYSPIIIESGNLDQWFQHSELAPETIELIRDVVYKRGNSLLFSDVSYVIAGINSDREIRRFLQALTRTRSLILRLRVSPDMDLNAIRDYWTSGYERKDILPVLEATANAQDFEYIDVIHLLPPTPRKFLYTYPSAVLGVDGQYPDSFWTSINFFRYHPEERFDDVWVAEDFAKANYERAEKPYRLGDLLILQPRKTGGVSQSCIFIADDIVYTKNGRSLTQPFMLMKISDLVATQPGDGPAIASVWRQKKE